MDSVANPIINFLLSTALMAWGFMVGMIQSQPSTDVISLILGPLGAVVLLILITWYLSKRNKEKDQRIEKLQDTIVDIKDKEIERLQKKLDTK